MGGATLATPRKPSAVVDTAAGPRARLRLGSVDILRGVIMILMALDHTRDFFGKPGISPTDLAQTTIPLFFTRWITHFCAPVFFLLTGTGAYLSLRKKIQTRVVAISIHSRPLADLSGIDAVPLLGIAI